MASLVTRENSLRIFIAEIGPVLQWKETGVQSEEGPSLDLLMLGFNFWPFICFLIYIP